jgi:hypothetical protein
MRLAFIYKSDAPFNAQYRALMPMAMMRKRGHEVLWWGSSEEPMPLRQLRKCDLIHIYRAADPGLLKALETLRSDGVALSWDNDDDIRSISRHSPSYARLGGLSGQHDFRQQVRAIRLANLVTTTSHALAAAFRDAGAEHVTVIGNFLPPEFTRGRRPDRNGLVIGWAALREHEADAKLLALGPTLLSTLGAQPQVRLVTIGIDLHLRHAHYEHRRIVPYERLGDALRTFDIGLAPLADIPFNRARSDIKLKEYAAAGVPWLASPVGEYRSLGPKHGGRLVSHDVWPRELERLINSRRDRLILAAKGRLWARRQTIELNVQHWENAFSHAIARRRGGS